MLKRALRSVGILVACLVLYSPAQVGATDAFFNPAECDYSGTVDCYKCHNIGFLNPPFCWALINGDTGRCGCTSGPGIACETAGEFCSWIICVG